MLCYFPTVVPSSIIAQTLQHPDRLPGYNDFKISADGEWLCALSLTFTQPRNQLLVFRRVSGIYQLTQTIELVPGMDINVGTISMSADGAVVAINVESYATPASNCGAVLIYRRVSNTYSLSQTIQHPTNVAANVRFGVFAGLSPNGNTLVVFSRDSLVYHVYENVSSNYTLVSTLTNSAGRTNPFAINFSPSQQYFIAGSGSWGIHVYKNGAVWQLRTTLSASTSFVIFNEIYLIKYNATANARGGFTVMTFNGTNWLNGTTVTGSQDNHQLALSMAHSLDYSKFYIAEPGSSGSGIREYNQSAGVFTYVRHLSTPGIFSAPGVLNYTPMYFDNTNNTLVTRETTRISPDTQWVIRVRRANQ
jgi:hypothetical protein